MVINRCKNKLTVCFVLHLPGSLGCISGSFVRLKVKFTPAENLIEQYQGLKFFKEHDSSEEQ
jgi:hypothetical protein